MITATMILFWVAELGLTTEQWLGNVIAWMDATGLTSLIRALMTIALGVITVQWLLSLRRGD